MGITETKQQNAILIPSGIFFDRFQFNNDK